MNTQAKLKRQHDSIAGAPATYLGTGRVLSMLSRRAWIGLALGGAATALVGERWWRKARARVIAADATPLTVHASPACVCCGDWVGHLERNRFHVTVENVLDVTTVKRKFGVPESLWSCHTAVTGGYIVEGHVPADLIRKLLAERPSIVGLAVPGMPSGSPGMESAKKDKYAVIAFTRTGETEIYAVR